MQDQQLKAGHLIKRSFADTSEVCMAVRRATNAAIENDTGDVVLDATHGGIVRTSTGTWNAVGDAAWEAIFVT